MSKETKAPPGSFEAEFNRRVDAIIERASKVGMSVSQLCKRSGAARATPDRWRSNTPLTVRLVDKFESVVAEAERKAPRN